MTGLTHASPLPAAAAATRARLFSTCSDPTDGEEGVGYARRVAEVARWSEAAGCEGVLLVHTGTSSSAPGS